MLIIHGTIVNGIGAAKGALQLQIPLLKDLLPQMWGSLSKCYAGTINIELVYPLVIEKPSHKSPPLQWDKGVPLEEFAFTEAELEIRRTHTLQKGWIYQPSLTPHRFNKRQIEFVCPKLAFSQGDDCEVRIPRDARIVQNAVIC
jgi:CTP-dependent riboflavin kinase